MKTTTWKILSEITPQTIDELREVLIQNRHLDNPKTFFHPLHPLEMSLAEVGIDEKEMKKALKRILLAKENKEDVMIFGDYDADGVCSTGILWEALRSIGILARPFIPDRALHGYGLSKRSLTAVLAEKKPDLLITVDNGIVAHEASAELKKLKIDTILTDHHQKELQEDGSEKLPTAVAILHTPQLSGAGVAWILARELNPKAAAKSLDLAAVATVADQMPLIGPSRSVVKWGIEALRKSERIGIQLLCAKANIEQSKIDVGTINYAIAPRINAMGRLKQSLDALRLLCTTNMVRAEELVNELHDTNVSRQELTSEMLAHALQSATQWENERVIIVASTEYHEGVIGLIAGKLAETYHKPAIAIAVGAKLSKASARSVSGVNIIELIRLVRDDLTEAGGHPMAAGFGLLSEKLEIVKSHLQKAAKEYIDIELLKSVLNVECLLPAGLVRVETVDAIQDFAPFGPGNREPVFGLLGLRVAQAATIGRDNKHLKIFAQMDSGKKNVTVLGWGMGELANQLAPNSKINIAGVLEVNEWKRKRNIQVITKDIQLDI